MAGPFTFGENARVRVVVEAIVYDSSYNPRHGYVVGEVVAGNSKLTLQLDPRAAITLGEQLARHGRQARKAERKASLKKARAIA